MDGVIYIVSIVVLGIRVSDSVRVIESVLVVCWFVGLAKIYINKDAELLRTLD